MTKEEIYQAALGTSAGEQAKFKTFLHAFRQAEGLLHICSRPFSYLKGLYGRRSVHPIGVVVILRGAAPVLRQPIPCAAKGRCNPIPIGNDATGEGRSGQRGCYDLQYKTGKFHLRASFIRFGVYTYLVYTVSAEITITIHNFFPCNFAGNRIQ